MKRLVAFLLAVMLCDPAGAVIAVRNSKSATASPITVTSTTTGDLLVIVIGIASTTTTVTSVCFDGTTCAAGNAFTQVPGARKVGATGAADMWYLANVASGKTTVTVTLSAASFSFAMYFAVSGAATSSPVDTVSAGTTGTSANNTGCTVNNANSGSILIAGEQTAGTISAVAGGFTEGDAATFPNGNSGSSDVPGNTTGHAPTYTKDNTEWESIGASFLPLAAATANSCTPPFCGVIGD